MDAGRALERALAPPRELRAERGRRPGPGRAPELALVVGIGLAVVAESDALSRSGQAGAQLLWWVGVLAIFLPLTARLAAAGPGRGERLTLAVLLGVALYLVKVLRDPFAFTYADELVHEHNVLAILSSGRLFGSNPILPVTPSYPGLEATTAALASTGGMPAFAAGLVVIGVARLILVLAVFLLYERVSGSARVAGLGTALYAASPHYLFFSAQFSYESLALPLALLAVLAVLRARPPLGGRRAGWAALAVPALVAVVATHHMTSYALAATLLAACLVPLPWRSTRTARPWAYAVLAVGVTVAWLVLVASRTAGYLTPVIGGAVSDAFRTATGESPARQLFSSSSGHLAPAWEQVVALGGAVIVAAATPLGLRALWLWCRHHPLAVVMGGASLGYLATLGLRLVPAAWELGARAAEFLFVGSGLVLALAAVYALERFGHRRLVGVLGGAAAGIMFMGSVISTASDPGRVAQPYVVLADGRLIHPEAVAAAHWTRSALDPGARIAAESLDARVLLIDGRRHVLAGTNPPIDALLQDRELPPWQLGLLREQRVRYVAVDARRASDDLSIGPFFPRHAPGPGELFPAAATRKFERAGADRIYDSGNIVIYDVAPLRHERRAP